MATMHDPAHPDESLRDALAAAGWTVTEAAAKLGCTRQTFSRLLNGRTGHLAGDGAGAGAHRVEQTRRSGCDGRRCTTWRRNASELRLGLGREPALSAAGARADHERALPRDAARLHRNVARVRVEGTLGVRRSGRTTRTARDPAARRAGDGPAAARRGGAREGGGDRSRAGTLGSRSGLKRRNDAGHRYRASPTE